MNVEYIELMESLYVFIVVLFFS